MKEKKRGKEIKKRKKNIYNIKEMFVVRYYQSNIIEIIKKKYL